MSTSEGPVLPTLAFSLATMEECLIKWKRRLVYEIRSADNTSTKVVGIVDGGSTCCLMSRRAARRAGLEIMPFKDGDVPVLEGFDGVLNCQPIGWVTAGVRQPDLDLNTTCMWRFFVVPGHKINLVLGCTFNQTNNIERKIFQAVEMGIDPKDYNNGHLSGHKVLVLRDSRGKSEGSPFTYIVTMVQFPNSKLERRKKEHDETRQKVTETTRYLWMAVQEMKENNNQSDSAERATQDIHVHSGQSSASSHQNIARSTSSPTWEVLKSQYTTNTSSDRESSATSAISAPCTTLTSPDSASMSGSTDSSSCDGGWAGAKNSAHSSSDGYR